MTTLLNPVKLFSYKEFVDLTADCVNNHKTTGSEQTKGRIEATVINFQRLNRIYKTAILNPELKKTVGEITTEEHWVMIAEVWCGDSAQVLPFVARIAEENPNIKFSIALRDENPELMDRYLTNGSRSIPILISFANDREIWKWGPRPAAIAQLVKEYKEKHPVLDKQEFEYNLHLWYGRDRGQSIQEDLLALLRNR